MRNKLILLFAGLFVAAPALAQENWAGTPVPPATGSAGIVSGTEYLTAQCNLRAPGNFRCADNPNAVREVFIPLSAFARSSTVEALGRTIAGQDNRIASLETLIADQNASLQEAFDVLAQDRRAARRGIAAAVAIGHAPMPSAPGRTSYDFNLATFRGQQAVGGSFMHRLDVEEPMAISFGFSSSGGRNHAARIGISGEF